jgi:hypothetical protein
MAKKTAPLLSKVYRLVTFSVGHALASERVQTFLGARFSGAERHRRRLAKVTDVGQEVLSQTQVTDACIQKLTDASAMDAWRNEGDPN